MKNLIISIISVFLSVIIINAQPTKIAIVGNSITEGVGVGVPSRDSYPAQLGMYLGADYEVGNFGVSGRTMLKHGDFPIWVEPLFEDALNFNADTLIILLGTNDSKPQNWGDYGDEFTDDYIAMIDTFSLVGDKVPEVWACLPPPAFSVKWGINDTVIVNEVIPAIEQVIAERNLNRVDFYTPFIGHNEYFPDDIHPNPAGANAMAKILYEVFTGDTVQKKFDVNAAKNKTVLTDTGENGGALIDGDPMTAWMISSLPAMATVDIGEPDSIDAFVLDFASSAERAVQYTIEGSLDTENWTTLADHSERTETDQLALADVITPQSFQYFKLTVTGANQAETDILLTEFQVLAYHGAHHANAMSVLIDRESSRYRYYKIYFTPFHNTGERTSIYRDAWDGDGFLQMTGFKSVEENLEYRATLKKGSTNSYYLMTYLDGVEIISDTIDLFNLDTGVECNSPLPADIDLKQNYPNPFNPWTRIIYTLAKPEKIRLTVVNSLGQTVAILIDKKQNTGNHAIYFDGSKLESGIYFCTIQSDTFIRSRKMVLLK
ncbi:discoidin domain-containing protein [bacterium]|nr:discoidin domain-containing protein [bacterium]RQV97206.1 MAG: T9SS C-terminal target domain-containing protein [bacterium]